MKENQYYSIVWKGSTSNLQFNYQAYFYWHSHADRVGMSAPDSHDLNRIEARYY